MPRLRPMAPTSELRQPQEPGRTARPWHGRVVTATSSHLRHGEGTIFSPQEQLELTGPPWSWSSHLQPIASPSWNRAVERGIQAWPLEVINAERVLTWYLSKTPKVSPVSYWQPELIYEPQGGRDEGLVASLLLYGMCRGEDVGWALVLLVKA